MYALYARVYCVCACILSVCVRERGGKGRAGKGEECFKTSACRSMPQSIKARDVRQATKYYRVQWYTFIWRNVFLSQNVSVLLCSKKEIVMFHICILF